jgi:hypothetical protein
MCHTCIINLLGNGVPEAYKMKFHAYLCLATTNMQVSDRCKRASMPPMPLDRDQTGEVWGFFFFAKFHKQWWLI